MDLSHMKWFQKPTEQFWRTVVLAVVVGAVAGALGAVAVWSSMLAYQARFDSTNPLPYALDRQNGGEGDGRAVEVAAVGARSVVDIFFEAARQNDGYYLPDEALGHGVVLTSDGWVMTHRSVVDPRRKRELRVGVGAVVAPVDTILEDVETGVLFMRLQAENLPPVDINSKDGLRNNDWLVAVQGENHLSVARVENPHARDESVVSSDKIQSYVKLTNVLPAAYVGCPLFDEAGAAVGLVISSDDGVDRAVPMTHLAPLFAGLFADEQLIRPALGVQGVHLAGGRDEEAGRMRGFLLAANRQTGLPAVRFGSPAAAAGLKDGDIILKVNGVLVSDEIDLAEQLLALKPEETVDLTVARGDEEFVVSVILGRRDSGRAY